MTEAAIIESGILAGKESRLAQMPPDCVAVLTMRNAAEPVVFKPGDGTDLLGRLLKRYQFYYMVKMSAFAGDWTHSAQSAEASFDFDFHIHLSAKVSDAAEFVADWGAGKSVFDVCLPELKSLLEDVALDYFPNELRRLKDRFLTIAEKMKGGDFVEGPVRILKCAITARYGPKTMSIMTTVTKQDIIEERGAEFLALSSDPNDPEAYRRLMDHRVRQDEETKRKLDFIRSNVTDTIKQEELIGEVIGQMLEDGRRGRPSPSPRALPRRPTERLTAPERSPRLITHTRTPEDKKE